MPDINVTLLLPQDMMNFVLEASSRSGLRKEEIIAAGGAALREVPERDLVARLRAIHDRLEASGKRLTGPRLELQLPERVVDRLVELAEASGLDGSTVLALGLTRLESLLPERRRGPAIREQVARYREKGWL